MTAHKSLYLHHLPNALRNTAPPLRLIPAYSTTISQHPTLIFQKTESADRDRCTGCEGDRARRLRGSFCSVDSRCGKSGRSAERYDQHSIRMSLISLEACILASDCLTPLPTCQMTASGGWLLNGYSPHSSSYHTVPNA